LIVFIEIGATARDPDDSRDKEHSEALARPSLNSRKVSGSAQHLPSKWATLEGVPTSGGSPVFPNSIQIPSKIPIKRPVRGSYEHDQVAHAARAHRNGGPLRRLLCHCELEKGKPMSFVIYAIGFVIMLIGVVYGAYLMHIPTHWIAVGAIVLLGVGILSGVKATRQRDSSE
jgi:hypothetical protein